MFIEKITEHFNLEYLQQTFDKCKSATDISPSKGISCVIMAESPKKPKLARNDSLKRGIPFQKLNDDLKYISSATSHKTDSSDIIPLSSF